MPNVYWNTLPLLPFFPFSNFASFSIATAEKFFNSNCQMRGFFVQEILPLSNQSCCCNLNLAHQTVFCNHPCQNFRFLPKFASTCFTYKQKACQLDFVLKKLPADRQILTGGCKICTVRTGDDALFTLSADKKRPAAAKPFCGSATAGCWADTDDTDVLNPL